MLPLIGCRRPHFEWLLQRFSVTKFIKNSCRRPHFEWLLQLLLCRRLPLLRCRRPHFEWLLQQGQHHLFPYPVVEDRILSGYYNKSDVYTILARSCRRPHFEWLLQQATPPRYPCRVVEDHILSGYYNIPFETCGYSPLSKTTF